MKKLFSYVFFLVVLGLIVPFHSEAQRRTRNAPKAPRETNVSRSNTRDVNRNVTNVNVNRAVVVRPPARPYPHPPVVYGGYRYNCFHPYYYHPYHPYYWGPVWHPVGFFLTALAVTAVAVTVANQMYYYDQGVYYVQQSPGYVVVQAPEGAVVSVIPEGSQTVVVNETVNNYYYGGTYYEKSDGGYKIVPPTAGTVVENLPEGGKEVKVEEVTYVKVGDVYYQPILLNGKNMYEVVQVEPEK